MRQHGLLGRVGDVEPVEPGQPRGGQDVGDRAAEHVEVQQAVDVAEAELVGFGSCNAGLADGPIPEPTSPIR